LLAAEGADRKATQLLPRLIPPVRAALRSSKSDIFAAAVSALVSLSAVVGSQLNAHLNVILPALNQKVFDKTSGAIVQEALAALDTNGGEAAYPIIKSKIPTYSRV
jgi:hypothetical protein